MKWTSETPTKVGWYWMKDDYRSPGLVLVTRDWIGDGMQFSEELSVGVNGDIHVPFCNIRWAGPIDKPGDRKWGHSPQRAGWYWQRCAAGFIEAVQIWGNPAEGRPLVYYLNGHQAHVGDALYPLSHYRWSGPISEPEVE